MPVIAVFVNESVSVSCSSQESSRLDADRRIGSVGIRSEWMVRDIQTVAIRVELGSGGSVLKIVFPVDFDSTGAFIEAGIGGLVLVSGMLPAVNSLHMTDKCDIAPYRCEIVLRVKFDSVDVIPVVASPEKIHPSVIIRKEIRVMTGSTGILGIRHQVVGDKLPRIAVLGSSGLVELIDIGCHPIEFSVVHHCTRGVKIKRKDV